METTTPTTTTTYVGMKIEELAPYLDEIHYDLVVTNGLLVLLVVYVFLRRILTYIMSFIKEGFV